MTAFGISIFIHFSFEAIMCIDRSCFYRHNSLARNLCNSNQLKLGRISTQSRWIQRNNRYRFRNNIKIYPNQRLHHSLHAMSKSFSNWHLFCCRNKERSLNLRRRTYEALSTGKLYSWIYLLNFSRRRRLVFRIRNINVLCSSKCMDVRHWTDSWTLHFIVCSSFF